MELALKVVFLLTGQVDEVQPSTGETGESHFINR